MYIDLHSHSSKLSSFIYGNNHAADGGLTSWTKVRLFPRILAHFCKYFDYNKCCFKEQDNKRGAARVVVWKDLKVTNSFTLESSFYGYTVGNKIIEYST